MTICFLPGQQECLYDFSPSSLPMESYITNLIIIFIGATHTQGEHTRRRGFGGLPEDSDYQVQVNLTLRPGRV